ncbi:DUF3267 domain-containing protein [Aeribacillus pallidus]|jgi:hypothetical protein|uniref:DUF3267 domain-containing protein n=1 Tax=Aeribacillus pallidus TaxID=33936 RepID=UPI003D2130D8
MHCWKTINLERQFGFHRIFIISLLIMCLVFSFMFVPLHSIHSEPLYDRHFLIFLSVLISIYPVHKLLHYLPIVRYTKKIKCQYRFMYKFIPLLMIRVKEPIPKRRFAFALLFPFLVLTPVFILGSHFFPHYVHYFTMMLAFHTGICVTDFIYIKSIWRSPKEALIEENNEGYEILIQQSPPVS